MLNKYIDDEKKEKAVLKDCLYQLTGLILYTFGHYFTAVFNEESEAWMVYDDNFVSSKKNLGSGMLIS